MTWGVQNPFQIEMDAQLYSTPARYVVASDKTSYILPSFHPDSKFYGTYMNSRQTNERIFSKLAETPGLPLRILAAVEKADKIPSILQWLQRAGYGSLGHSLLDCKHFRTRFGRYDVCELSGEEK